MEKENTTKTGGEAKESYRGLRLRLRRYSRTGGKGQGRLWITAAACARPEEMSKMWKDC